MRVDGGPPKLAEVSNGQSQMLSFFVDAQTSDVTGLGTFVQCLGARPDQLGLELERCGCALDFEGERTARPDLDALIELDFCPTGREIGDPHRSGRGEGSRE